MKNRILNNLDKVFVGAKREVIAFYWFAIATLMNVRIAIAGDTTAATEGSIFTVGDTSDVYAQFQVLFAKWGFLAMFVSFLGWLLCTNKVQEFCKKMTIGLFVAYIFISGPFLFEGTVNWFIHTVIGI